MILFIGSELFGHTIRHVNNMDWFVAWVWVIIQFANHSTMRDPYPIISQQPVDQRCKTSDNIVWSFSWIVMAYHNRKSIFMILDE